MEGHQRDSQTDINNNQKKKHIRNRTCDRMLTEAITQELKRLCGFNDADGIDSLNYEHIPIEIINEVCMNQIIINQNNIPSSIVSLSKVKKNMGNGSQSKIELKRNNSRMSKNLGETKINSMIEYQNPIFDARRCLLLAHCLYEASCEFQRIINKPNSINAVQPNILILKNDDSDGIRKLETPTRHDNMNFGPEQCTTQNTAFRDNAILNPEQTFCMKFVIPLFKLRGFLRAMQTFYSGFKINGEVDNNVPCIIRSWHFHNIIQGYLLGLLLKNMNINSLNTMRKLYFVMITRSTAHVTVEVAIKLRSSIFTVYDNNIHYYTELFKINRLDKFWITKSKSMASLEIVIQNRLNQRKRNQLRIMLYSNQQQNMSNLGCEASPQIPEIVNDIYYEKDDSSTESVHSNTSECSTILLHQSFTFMIEAEDEVSQMSPTRSTQTLDCGSIINNIFHNNYKIYNLNILHSKQWLTKLLPANSCNTVKDKFQLKNIMNMFNFNAIKQTVIDKTSMQLKNLESVSDLYWTQVTSQTFYMFFLKSLGHSIANIFFSTVI